MPTAFNRDRHIFKAPDFSKIVDDAVSFLLRSPTMELNLSVQFEGAGVYALYYMGDFAAYSSISVANKHGLVSPIYVGKAVPRGWRQGRTHTAEADSLHQRLGEHARSIQSVENLRIEHFSCRFMILDGRESDLISIVESELVRTLRPLWNSVVDGFGNHDPGSGRYDQRPSEWDVLHPGRAWAKRLRGEAMSRQTILDRIRASTAP